MVCAASRFVFVLFLFWRCFASNLGTIFAGVRSNEVVVSIAFRFSRWAFFFPVRFSSGFLFCELPQILMGRSEVVIPFDSDAFFNFFVFLRCFRRWIDLSGVDEGVLFVWIGLVSLLSGFFFGE